LTDLIRGMAEPLQNTRIAAGGSNPQFNGNFK
jgi:hypothetical protein